MWRWYTLLSFRASLADIAAMRAAVAAGGNPRDYMVALASELVDRFHGPGAGDAAVRHWNEVVRGGAVPADLPLQQITVPADGIRLGALLRACGLAAYGGEANRKIAERAVRLDGVVTEDRELSLRAGGEHLLQLGKRGFARVSLVEA
jgi:tyrosyl-tRNA synthetase